MRLLVTARSYNGSAYQFRDEVLCETALTHKSWLNERPGEARADNERLEFLGDAVIALVVSDLLMRRFPDHPEGELSKKRAALVNEAGLARVAEALTLGQWIFLGRGEEQAGGRQKRSILADALEALIGAVYRDGGFDAAYGVAERLFARALDDAGIRRGAGLQVPAAGAVAGPAAPGADLRGHRPAGPRPRQDLRGRHPAGGQGVRPGAGQVQEGSPAERRRPGPGDAAGG